MLTFKMNFIVVFIFVAFAFSFVHSHERFHHLHKLKPKTTDEAQAQAAYEVIKRLIPDRADQFKITVDRSYTEQNFDKFTILKNDSVIEIIGSSGVAATWGFHYYLKYYCLSHIGWKVKQITIPVDLPEVNLTIVSKDRIRYYQNVCTTSYSFVWWNLEDWRKHIDWMALNGFNLALAPHAQESIWQIVYKKMNLTDPEIEEHFSGPAFLSWQRMGNLRGWGGPLSDEWHKHTINLQTFVVKAMTDLGITPALPAFAGFVPKAFKRLFPQAKLSEVEVWNNFPAQYCCPLFLNPTDPLFSYIGKLFLTEMTSKFGQTHIYYSDSFNEVRPTSEDNEFLKNVGHAIYETMTSVDHDSVWLLQNWMFVNEHDFWTMERAKAFLTSVPIGRMLILDLQSEQWPQFEKFDMYFGQPFIWNMLHNFGGTLGMFGNAKQINENVYKVRNASNSTMIGIGITPEGINQNYIMYDLVMEIPWNGGSIDIDNWAMKYAQRRYGFLDEHIRDAWSMLINTVYNYRGLNRIRGKYAITRRPTLSIDTWAWYSKKDLVKSWESLLNGNVTYHKSDSYRHDLVDVTRQFLQYQGDQLYPAIITAYTTNNSENFTKYAQLFLDVFDDLEEILSTHHNFLLGNWLNSAKNISSSKKEKELFEFNARNQITLWGPDGQIVDYANKQWAGVILDYFKPRWEIFLKAMSECMVEGVKFNKKKVKQDMFSKVEKPFTLDNKEYSTIENGDSYQTSKNIFEKWSKINLNLPDVPIKILTKLPTNQNEIDELLKNDDEIDLKNIPKVTIIY